MSRLFSKIKPTFWTGNTGRAMRSLKGSAGKDAMLLAGYLIGGPSANHYGLYQVDAELCALHLPVSAKEVDAAFITLEELGFAFYDRDSRWVWVREMAAQQLGTPLKSQDNQITSLKRWYETCPKNPWLGPFFDRYVDELFLGHDSDRTGRAVQRRDGGPSKALASPSEGAISSPSLSLVPLGVGGVGGGERRVATRAPGWRESTFEVFWQTYPRKKNRKEAFLEWSHEVKDEAMARHVIERLKLLLDDFNYEDNGKRIVYPERWIKRHCWEDEPSLLPGLNQRTSATARAVQRAAQRGAPK